MALLKLWCRQGAHLAGGRPGQPGGEASTGLGTASWVMVVFSAAAVLLSVLTGRHRAVQGTLADAAASAAAVSITLPTAATAVQNLEAAPPGPRERGTEHD